LPKTLYTSLDWKFYLDSKKGLSHMVKI